MDSRHAHGGAAQSTTFVTPDDAAHPAPAISVIIPVLNEENHIAATLGPLLAWRDAGHEIIVVDGGSTDRTVSVARPLADQLLVSPRRGRAHQMNHGARAAYGDILLFLHADTQPPAGAAQEILAALATQPKGWGFFRVRFTGGSPVLAMVAFMMNLRSRLSGIATGDQAVFVRRPLFDAVGGYPAIPLMEDIALCRRLKHIHRPICLGKRVTTSSRRWERHGVWRTVILMWRLRLAYFFGADPGRLARRYHLG
jgi:rSAM/selenodomain-associated transferase 2